MTKDWINNTKIKKTIKGIQDTKDSLAELQKKGYIDKFTKNGETKYRLTKDKLKQKQAKDWLNKQKEKENA